jgi:hypothetical protein
MGLRTLHERKVNTDFVCLQTQERGGILSIATSGGLTFAEYALNPSGARPLGIQLNDIENINLTREYDPRRLRKTDFPCGTVGAGLGQYETDWLFLIGTVNPGDKAYVGPSGTITNSTSFGGDVIGFFTSVLNSEPHLVVFRGLGLTFSVMDNVTKRVVIENDPNNMICLPSPGFIGVKINF